MTTEELAVSYHDRECNCCQCVLCSLAKYTGIEEEEALAIGYGFGGGMACGNVCGAVTGSLMAIGKSLLYRKNIAESRPIGKELALEFEQLFEEKHGSLLCSVLTEPEGKTVCEGIIKDTALLAEQFIQEHLNKKD